MSIYREYITIKEAFQEIQKLYASSGRDEKFINTIYPKELIRFYSNCEYSLRNIIITSNINSVPYFMMASSAAFIKKKFIFVYIIYLDNIDKYNASAESLSRGRDATNKVTTKNKSFIDYTNDYLYVKQLNKSNLDHNFSKMIGIPKQISTMLSSYPNSEWFNILDMNHYNNSKKKMYNSVDFHTFMNCLEEK